MQCCSWYRKNHADCLTALMDQVVPCRVPFLPKLADQQGGIHVLEHFNILQCPYSVLPRLAVCITYSRLSVRVLPKERSCNHEGQAQGQYKPWSGWRVGGGHLPPCMCIEPQPRGTAANGSLHVSLTKGSKRTRGSCKDIQLICLKMVRARTWKPWAHSHSVEISCTERSTVHVAHAEDQDKPVKAHCRFCGKDSESYEPNPCHHLRDCTTSRMPVYGENSNLSPNRTGCMRAA